MTDTSVGELWEARCVSHPEAEFLVFEDPDSGRVRRYTYGQFDSRVEALADILAYRGIRAGDRVATLLHNSVEFIETLLALAKIGGILVPINAASTPCEARYILGHTGARLVVSDPDLGADLESPQLHIRGCAEGGYSTPPAPPRARRDSPAGSDLFQIMFTSGTTSRPKGVMLSHRNATFSGEFCVWQMAMTSTDRLLTSMAMSHINFQFSALMPVIEAGATLVALTRYSATRFWRSVRRHRATLVQGMAMIARTMLKQPVDPGERDHVVRDMHYFLPLSDAEKEEFTSRFGVTLLNNYGSTESLVGVITDPPVGERRWPSIGRIGPGYRARICAEDGTEQPAGQCGELYIHGIPGVSLMMGYWNDPAATAAVLADGWYRTGDYAVVDEEGWFFFLDRHLDLIKRAGENVSATEVECVLSGCPGVEAVAVVGVVDEVRDMAVKAVVVPASEHVTADSIIDYASRRLSYFKVPTIIEFRSALPRGAYGKVNRQALKEPAETSDLPRACQPTPHITTSH